MNQRCLHALVYVSLLAVAPLRAASAHDSAESLRACKAESDNARRLACYDREIAQLPTPTSVEQPAAVVPATTPTLSAEESFGLSEQQARKKQDIGEAPKLERLSARVAELSRRPHGELVITLDNGQIWAQKQAESLVVEVGDTVTIKAGALGSFLMSTASGRFTRVKRER